MFFLVILFLIGVIFIKNSENYYINNNFYSNSAKKTEKTVKTEKICEKGEFNNIFIG